MTLMQEAYSLMQKQPEKNVKIIVDLLRTMVPEVGAKRSVSASPAYKRTGVAKGTAVFPADYDEHFNDFNEEIATMFSGELE